MNPIPLSVIVNPQISSNERSLSILRDNSRFNITTIFASSISEFEKQTKEWVIENAYRIKDIEMFKKYFFTPNISKELNLYINKCLHQ